LDAIVAREPIALLTDLERHFAAGDVIVRALQSVCLTVEHGDYVTVMGPSGSGKSTLLNILGLLDRPTAGTFHLDGIDVGTLTDRDRCHLRARRIGFVFQSFHLLAHISAFQNVKLGTIYTTTPRAKRRTLAYEALERVGLAHRADFLPPTMSGGERQRVAVARAIVANPSLLLCDEPTGNLDTETGSTVLDVFAELRQSSDLTLIVVTHDPDVGDRADRTVHIRDGFMVTT